MLSFFMLYALSFRAEARSTSSWTELPVSSVACCMPTMFCEASALPEDAS